MHDVAVVLDLHLLGDARRCRSWPPGRRRCGRGRAASGARPAPWDRPAGPSASASSSALSTPRRRVPAIGRTVTVPSRSRTRISGLEPTSAKLAEVEEEQERGGVEPAQRPIERERRQAERQVEPLRGHHLEDVAGADVLLRPLDHRVVPLTADVGDRLRRRARRSARGSWLRPRSNSATASASRSQAWP